jgi:hypothetical protein
MSALLLLGYWLVIGWSVCKTRNYSPVHALEISSGVYCVLFLGFWLFRLFSAGHVLLDCGPDRRWYVHLFLSVCCFVFVLLDLFYFGRSSGASIPFSCHWESTSSSSQ